MIATHAEAACEACGKPFQRFTSFQRVCRTFSCANKIVKADKRREAERRRADRMLTRAKLEAMKSLAQLRKEAQTEFNAFIRKRDQLAGRGCICCGAPLDWNSNKPGGAVDAGHFVSRGSAIELAFDERNTNAQRKSCNRPGGTTRAKFTVGMTERWGAAVVAELEGPHDLPHLKHDDFRRLKATYRIKARELQKETT